MRRNLVLVTGASGFVGKWTVIELLRAGYSVRGAFRSAERAESVKQAVIAQLGDEVLYRLSFVKLDLMLDNGWAKAMLKVDAIVHTAAKVVTREPKDPGKVVGPAVEGTERVLRFATRAGVRRIVMTSSVVTIGYGHGPRRGPHIFSETDNTELDGIGFPWAYCVAKTKAERVAWAYARNEGLELTTIHPGAVLGPALDGYVSPSLRLVSGLLNGSTPALPHCGFSIIDVRDVAALHVAALNHDAAIGERFLAASDYVSLSQIAQMLAASYPAQNVTRRTVPDWVIKLLARFGGPSRLIANDIGNEKHYTRDKGEALLGHPYRSADSAILAAAESLFALGLLERHSG